jgi:hypothetical protein
MASHKGKNFWQLPSEALAKLFFCVILNEVKDLNRL